MDIFRASIIDVSERSLVVEVTGDSDKVEAMVNMLRPFGIKEMVRTGRVAMTRGPRAVGGHGATPGPARGGRQRRTRSGGPAGRRLPETVCRALATQYGGGRTSNIQRGRDDASWLGMYYDQDADLEVLKGIPSPSSATAARGTPTR